MFWWHFLEHENACRGEIIQDNQPTCQFCALFIKYPKPVARGVGVKQACVNVTAANQLTRLLFVPAVKPVVPKCSVPKSVPFGKSAELSCVEEEGFPKSQYQWFKNREEIPDDPKTSLKFFNSSYTLSAETGTLVSASAHALARTRTRNVKQGRDGSGHGGPAPRGGGGYFGETVDGARGLEPRGESAVLVCTFFNSLSRSSLALHSPTPATIPQPQHRQPSLRPLTRGLLADCTPLAANLGKRRRSAPTQRGSCRPSS